MSANTLIYNSEALTKPLRWDSDMSQYLSMNPDTKHSVADNL